ncbi:HAMP domain-containing histidine kinase [candidate division WOR-3 bacterium]|nr:HAMP domain-containing histidine kinase [candidate division WOR-3 bacterium]
MKKYNYIFLIIIIIIIIFISFSQILYSNIRREIINSKLINDNIKLLKITPFIEKSMILLLDANDNRISIDSLYLYADSIVINDFISSNDLFIDLDSTMVFQVDNDSFHLINKTLFNNHILSLHTNSYLIGTLSHNWQDYVSDESRSKMETLLKTITNYGYFETKDYIFNYRHSEINGKGFFVIMRRIKAEALKELRDFAILLGIMVFIALIMIAIFLALFVQANARIIKIEEKIKREIEFIRLNKLLGIETLSEGIIHNINNPLTSVKGYLQILISKEPKIADKYNLNRVIRNLDQVGIQINSILNKTKKDLSEEKTDININELISDIVNLKGNNIQSKSINLTMSLEKDLPVMNGVFGDISIIIENLLDNAIDSMFYTQEKFLSIKTEYNDKNIYLKVKDTGIGMKQPEIEKIYDLYYTSKSNTSKNGEPVGTGIGMYTVKQALKKNNWYIECNSEKNRGTEFILIMPYNKIKKQKQNNH